MRKEFGNDLNSFLPIRNGQSFKAVVFKKKGEHLLNSNFIFNNQNPFLFGDFIHMSPLLIHQIVWVSPYSILECILTYDYVSQEENVLQQQYTPQAHHHYSYLERKHVHGATRIVPPG